MFERGICANLVQVCRETAPQLDADEVDDRKRRRQRHERVVRRVACPEGDERHLLALQNRQGFVRRALFNAELGERQVLILQRRQGSQQRNL